jgi:hypothetical protein
VDSLYTIILHNNEVIVIIKITYCTCCSFDVGVSHFVGAELNLDQSALEYIFCFIELLHTMYVLLPFCFQFCFTNKDKELIETAFEYFLDKIIRSYL